MTAEMIEKYIAAGAKRWTMGSKDRLYINAEVLGYDWSKYNTGNISTATLNGEHISNSEMRRVLSAKTYIDIADGKLHKGYNDDFYNDAVEAFIKKVEEA